MNSSVVTGIRTLWRADTRQHSEILCTGFSGSNTWEKSIGGAETVFTSLSDENIGRLACRPQHPIGAACRNQTKVYVYKINSYGLRCYIVTRDFFKRKNSNSNLRFQAIDNILPNGNSVLVSHFMIPVNRIEIYKGRKIVIHGRLFLLMNFSFFQDILNLSTNQWVILTRLTMPFLSHLPSNAHRLAPRVDIIE